MKSHYQNLMSDIRGVYELFSKNATLNTDLEIKYLHNLIPDLERSHAMTGGTLESLIQAISHAAKLGLTLSPDKGLATLSAITTSNNSLEYYLDVPLAGIKVTMSRITEYKLAYLDVVTGDDGIGWSGDVFGTNCPAKAPVKNEMIKGAICIIEVPNGDSLVTTITIRELKELSRLSSGDLKSLSPEFAKRHVFKRALKNLIAPPRSLMSELQQATKDIDIALFNHNREFSTQA
ncbi:TPA: hypothetical protein KDY05_002027 [Vibrio parahaemolyticus]|nr:hypothetical protein [Vibrio parahaemolyticus]